MFLKKIFLVSVFVCLMVFCGCKGKDTEQSAAPKSAPEDVSAEAISKAGGFSLSDQDGNKVSLADFSGKIVVLEWINYDCPFVVAHYESGTMKNLAEKYAGKGVVWLGINSTNYATVQTNKEFVEKNSLSYPVLDDHDGSVGRLYEAKTTPHIIIMDGKGQIAYNGAIDNAPMGKVTGEYVNYADKALEELVAGESVTTPATKPYGCTVKYAE